MAEIVTLYFVCILSICIIADFSILIALLAYLLYFLCTIPKFSMKQIGQMIISGINEAKQL